MKLSIPQERSIETLDANMKEPSAKSIVQPWHKKFMGTGSVLQREGAGRPQTQEETESVRAAHITARD